MSLPYRMARDRIFQPATLGTAESCFVPRCPSSGRMLLVDVFARSADGRETHTHNVWACRRHEPHVAPMLAELTGRAVLEDYRPTA